MMLPQRLAISCASSELSPPASASAHVSGFYNLVVTAVALGSLLVSFDAGAADQIPVRTQRRWAIAGEAGWNGLAGLGANFTYNVMPRLSLDLGLGVSAVGLKSGARVRANLLESRWTPIVGLGFLYGWGAGDEEIKFTSKGDTARFHVRSSPYLQSVVGVNFTGSGGLTFMATAGYAFLLRRENLEFISGSTAAYDDARGLCGSGVVLGASLGYAF